MSRLAKQLDELGPIDFVEITGVTHPLTSEQQLELRARRFQFYFAKVRSEAVGDGAGGYLDAPLRLEVVVTIDASCIWILFARDHVEARAAILPLLRTDPLRRVADINAVSLVAGAFYCFPVGDYRLVSGRLAYTACAEPIQGRIAHDC